MPAKLVGCLTAKLVDHLTASLVDCVTAKLVNRLTAKCVVVNLVKLHLTKLNALTLELPLTLQVPKGTNVDFLVNNINP